jgi:hypothetical protein
VERSTQLRTFRISEPAGSRGVHSARSMKVLLESNKLASLPAY